MVGAATTQVQRIIMLHTVFVHICLNIGDIRSFDSRLLQFRCERSGIGRDIHPAFSNGDADVFYFPGMVYNQFQMSIPFYFAKWAQTAVGSKC